MDTPRWPTPPSLDISLMHAGWTAAQQGEPLDVTMGRLWMEGYHLWFRVKWFGATRMPRVFPRY
jgi:hypothetical protein